ncbi:hypothetical protein JOQ06_007704 [Pogonophryne albipinna]|uniref:Nucleolar protein 4 helical domain-containing protein n=1 Tax=Pogonophryne albipinna TaxID=1090488 RepID=A0AAD6B280_9TELE|nr:hypothetical protein JOQ06_007704 [Pogonophryne albipinna]
MEAVVLAISHFHGVSYDPLPSPPAREKSESSFYGDRCSDGNSAQDNSSLKRVAVVEDFFDIIYAMHVEMGADPGRAPKHAGQKKTYKADGRQIFLPPCRGPVMSHSVNPFEEQLQAGGGVGGGGTLLWLHGHVKVGVLQGNARGGVRIAETYAFLPREAVTRFLMSCGECQKRMHINPSTAEFKENDRPTSLVPDLIDYNMPLTATYLKQMKLQCMTPTERDDSSVSSEDMMNGVESTWIVSEPPAVPEPSPTNGERVSNQPSAVKEEDDDESSESGSAPGLPPPEGPHPPPDGGEDQQPVNLSDRLLPAGGSPTNNRKFPVKTEYNNNNKSPPYSSGSYDSGSDPERLKAFNMFVRLFVDENLDRMVPISKQPKEKIQAILESCGRQFPEFEGRSRKRIRTYLKSCRRLKKSGFEIRPTPPHLTSATAENILATACDNETRNAAKRMRLDSYPADEPSSGEKSSSRDPASLTPSGFSISSAAFAQEQLLTNGGLNFNLRYGGVPPSPGNTQTNGPTDLSMKSIVAPPSSSSSSSQGQGGGGGGASAQLSLPEVTAVRQLIAGYRDSAAFLLRSADELENLILQQN